MWRNVLIPERLCITFAVQKQLRCWRDCKFYSILRSFGNIVRTFCNIWEFFGLVHQNPHFRTHHLIWFSNSKTASSLSETGSKKENYNSIYKVNILSNGLSYDIHNTTVNQIHAKLAQAISVNNFSEKIIWKE